MQAIQFGTGKQVYEIPSTDQSFNGRSVELNAPVSQLPGTNGGYPGLGYGPAPVRVRQMSLSFRLFANTREEMLAKRDELARIATWGVRRLVAESADKTRRWINCRVVGISAPEQPAWHTDLIQPVTVNFVAADPHWYSQGTESPIWGGGSLWGGGALWGGAGVPQACSGLQTDFTVTHNGTAFARPRIFITVADGDTASNIRVQRIVGGSVVDQVRYTGTLSPSGSDNVVQINTKALTATLDGSDIFTSANWDRPQNLWWFRLPKADSSIRVLMNNSGDACTVEMKYYDTYI